MRHFYLLATNAAIALERIFLFCCVVVICFVGGGMGALPPFRHQEEQSLACP